MATGDKSNEKERLDRVVADAQRDRLRRDKGYREQALKLYPWICGRCSREFTRANLQELTVHHRDHDHDNNPSDGSNWELLCVFCHDNEHQRRTEALVHGPTGADEDTSEATKHNPFQELKSLLKSGK